MNEEQLRRMHEGKGFIAALDQSGGSTPKTLAQYGIPDTAYSGESEMYRLVHAMRARILTSPAFRSEYILAAILFENTLQRTVDGEGTADFLWKRKGIVPFLKIDKGLAERKNGVQLMKPIPGLDDLLHFAAGKNVFGAKMRSVISEANPEGVAAIVAQQFELAGKIARAGLVPIIEPEIDIRSTDRKESEKLLKWEIRKYLAALDPETRLIFKFSIPVTDNFYRDLMDDPHVVRVVALSGGFPLAEANERLARNNGLIASFSRALAQGLSVSQNDEEFDAALETNITSIYAASIT